MVDMVLKDVVVHWQEARQGDPTVAGLHAVVRASSDPISERYDECLLLHFAA